MEERVTPGQIGLRYGLIYALVSTVINLIPILTESNTGSMSAGFILTLANIITAFVVFILAGRAFKKLNGGMISFGEGFKINIIAAAIMELTRALIVYLYVKVIDPGYTERVKRFMEEMWEKQGLTQEQIDQFQGFSAGATNPELMLASGLFGAILGGLIWGAISSAITKTEEEEF